MKTEYFILANSFAAPFFSDTSTSFESADTPEKALEQFAKNYKHPAGLFAAVCYESADAYHKDKPPLAEWLSNHAIEKEKIMEKTGGISYLGHGPGDFEINGKRYHVENPKEGRVV